MSDEIKDMLRAILGRLDEQGAQLNGINECLDRMDGRIAQIEQRLERVEQSQERAELVLEKLALRSIEHESLIDALRRTK